MFGRFRAVFRNFRWAFGNFLISLNLEVLSKACELPRGRGLTVLKIILKFYEPLVN